MAEESSEPNEPKLSGQEKQRRRYLERLALTQEKWSEQHAQELEERRLQAAELRKLSEAEALRLLELDPSGFLQELVLQVEEIRRNAQTSHRPDFKAALQAVHDLAALIKGRDGAKNKLWLSEPTEPEPKKAAKVNGRTVVTTAGTDTTDIQAIKAELAEQERIEDDETTLHRATRDSDELVGRDSATGRPERGENGSTEREPSPLDRPLPPFRQDEVSSATAPIDVYQAAETGSEDSPTLSPGPELADDRLSDPCPVVQLTTQEIDELVTAMCIEHLQCSPDEAYRRLDAGELDNWAISDELRGYRHLLGESKPTCPACGAPNACVPGETLKSQLWLNCRVCGRTRVRRG